jgi:hypothetical protein
MSKLLLCLFLASTGCYCASGGGVSAHPVTVLLDFDKPHSAMSLQAMEEEVGILLKATGLSLDWQMKNEIRADAEFAGLVVIKLTGHCTSEAVAMPMDERGPLAFAHSSEGEVLPFGQVECDRVRNSLRSLLAGRDGRTSDVLLGRALGRVLAHEMYHMLANDKKHTKSGVTRERLRADELTAGHMDLAASALIEMTKRHTD